MPRRWWRLLKNNVFSETQLITDISIGAANEFVEFFYASVEAITFTFVQTDRPCCR